LLLRRAEDLQQLLPERMPLFQPGAKPVPGTDLVVDELLGVGGFGEVWKARHQSRPHLPPVALKFCIDETAARTLKKKVELLNRVTRQGRHRGIVELRNMQRSSQRRPLSTGLWSAGPVVGVARTIDYIELRITAEGRMTCRCPNSLQ
jgi:hypothetical protein